MQNTKAILLFVLFGASAIIATHIFYQYQEEKYAFEFFSLQEDITKNANILEVPANTAVFGPNPLNNSYYIDGVPVSLKDGVSTVVLSEDPEVIQTTEATFTATGDVNRDDREDTALILTRTIGERSRNYIALALQDKTGYFQGSAAYEVDPNATNISATIGSNNITVSYEAYDKSYVQLIIVEGLRLQITPPRHLDDMEMPVAEDTETPEEMNEETAEETMDMEDSMPADQSNTEETETMEETQEMDTSDTTTEEKES